MERGRWIATCMAAAAMLDRLHVTARTGAVDLRALRAELAPFHLRVSDDTRALVDVRAHGVSTTTREAAVVDAAAWGAVEWDPFAFDADVVGALERGAGVLHVCGEGPELARTALTVITRYQRYLRPTCDGGLAAVVAAHRALHESAKPLVRADYDHARDTWMWLLRLAPDASPALQLAALFHDVERLTSEADERREHLAPSYDAFKATHAAGGARMLEDVLLAFDVGAPVRARAVALVASHERPGSDPELALLNDADALSFFSLNSPGYCHYYGPSQTEKKVAWTLRRLSAAGRARLASIRLRSDLQAMVARAEDAQRLQATAAGAPTAQAVAS